jgi:hypothetical protein
VNQKKDTTEKTLPYQRLVEHFQHVQVGEISNLVSELSINLESIYQIIKILI